MKLFYQACLAISIILGVGNEACKASQGPVVPQLGWEEWFLQSADVVNPFRVPVKLGFYVSSLGCELLKAAGEAVSKKEWTERLSAVSAKGAAVLLSSTVVWFLYRYTFKKFYNDQIETYAYIREITKKHYELYYPQNGNVCLACYNYNKALYHVEKTVVLSCAEKLRRVSCLYLLKDAYLVTLLENFYTKLEAQPLQSCYNEYATLQNYCAGFI